MEEKAREETKYNDLLASFVIEKNKKVLKSVGFVYANEADVQDIKSWEPKEAERVYKLIKMRVIFLAKTEIRGLSEHTCPWCIKYKGARSPCDVCSYRINHGVPCLRNPLISVHNCNKISINYIEMMSAIEDLWDEQSKGA